MFLKYGRIYIDAYLKLQLQRLNCNTLAIEIDEKCIVNRNNEYPYEYEYKCFYQSYDLLLQKIIVNRITSQEITFKGKLCTKDKFVLETKRMTYDGHSDYVTFDSGYNGLESVRKIENFPRRLQNTIFSDIERNIKIVSMLNQESIDITRICTYNGVYLRYLNNTEVMYCHLENILAIFNADNSVREFYEILTRDYKEDD